MTNLVVDTLKELKMLCKRFNKVLDTVTKNGQDTDDSSVAELSSICEKILNLYESNEDIILTNDEDGEIALVIETVKNLRIFLCEVSSSEY